jgi:hypothetical protein
MVISNTVCRKKRLVKGKYGITWRRGVGWMGERRWLLWVSNIKHQFRPTFRSNHSITCNRLIQCTKITSTAQLTVRWATILTRLTLLVPAHPHRTSRHKTTALHRKPPYTRHFGHQRHRTPQIITYTYPYATQARKLDDHTTMMHSYIHQHARPILKKWLILVNGYSVLNIWVFLPEFGFMIDISKRFCA